MRIAARAMNFGTLDQHAEIGSRADILIRNGRPKAGPAGAGIKLGIGAEDGGVAADAAKEASLMHLKKRTAERYVGALLARHIILLGAELLAPFAAGPDHFLDARCPELFP